eukprot:287775-Rhodomonas_salina.1
MSLAILSLWRVLRDRDQRYPAEQHLPPVGTRQQKQAVIRVGFSTCALTRGGFRVDLYREKAERGPGLAGVVGVDPRERQRHQLRQMT